MRIVLNTRQTLEENAKRYFEAAKKARHKAHGAQKAIEEWRRRQATPAPERTAKQVATRPRKREWYEKFRWCFSSDGFLLIGGRDATTNEMLIKHHAEKGDVVFHTDMAGSPFVVIKAGEKEVPSRTLDEAAQFCAAFSRAWKNGFSVLEVFHVTPDQVTKEPNPGEYLPKGAFMIRGKTIYHRPQLKAAIGLDKEGRVMAGPPDAVAAHCAKSIEILQGNEKTSDVAKELRKRLGGEIDEIVAALPPGGCRLPPSR